MFRCFHAFIDETQRIFNRHPARSASGMMRYMLGTNDYYKGLQTKRGRIRRIFQYGWNSQLGQRVADA